GAAFVRSRSAQLVKMDTSNQVLCSYYLMILRNIDGSSNHKSMLNQCWCNGDYALNRNFATLLSIGELTITCCCREVCVEIGIAKAPATRCQVKPSVSLRIRNMLTSHSIGPIEQVRICDLGFC